MTKPIYSDSQFTGNLAVTFIQSFIEEKRWLFRRGEGSTDFGIDAEMEIVDKNLVTGKLIKVQSKGSDSLEFENGYEAVQIKTTTWNNWKEINIPVVCFLCETGTKKIYWCLPLGYEPKENKESVTIKFFKEDCLNTNFQKFNAIVNAWIETFPKYNILLEVPFFHQLYTETLKGIVDGYDAWCEADQEYILQARVFYQHVLELRSSVGLINEHLLSYNDWLIRNQGVWNETVLYYGTLSELTAYIGYYYKEAFERLIKRLEKVEERFENNEILYYFQRKGILKKYFSHWYHELHDSSLFHQKVEAQLERTGYKPKFKWQNKRK